MKVTFTFTDSPRGARELHLLTGVVYSVYDREGTFILTGEGGIHELAPGEYCIYAQKYKDQENIYFAQQTFEVPTEIPEQPFPIMPPPLYDLQIIVYMEIIPTEEKEEIPCPEMYPEEGDGSLIWLLILAILLMGGA